MHPEQIKAAMRMKGVTLAALADELKVSGVTVSQVIAGKTESARVKARIAQIVGMPVASIWAPKAPSPLRRVKSASPVAA